MLIEDLSELELIVKGLKILVDSGMDIKINIPEIRIIHEQSIVIGNKTHDFVIKLNSDDVENLMGNALNKIKVIK